MSADEGYMSRIGDLLPTDLATSVRLYVVRAQAAATALALLADRMLGLIAADASGGDAGGASGLVAMVVLALAGLLVVQWFGRMVMWWTRLALRGLLWALLAGVALRVWSSGLEAAVSDAVGWCGGAVGYLAGLRVVWLDEYERQQRQQAAAGGATALGVGGGAVRGRGDDDGRPRAQGESLFNETTP